MDKGVLDVLVPDLGDVAEVVVVEWLKSPGEALIEGEDLVEVESEKTAFVVPAPVGGTLLEHVANVGDRLKLGALLGRIDPQ